ncbi:MAG: hypothetical protein A2X64_02330 [Ignavibacteria bacterium GWF2_33_9]|nr:MAG: hypothetical protein A2X64_02330 [Ignavibacteria bacterium GWF2_33_9]
MKNTLLLVFALISAIFFSNEAYSKKSYIPYVGTESWNSIELSCELSEVIDIEYEFESRFELDYEKDTKHINNFGLSYKPLFFLKLDGVFRIKHKNTIPSVELITQANFKYEINPLEFQYRLRFQYKFKDYERIWRQRIKAEYKFLEDFSLELASEMFLNVYSSNFSKFEENRSTLSLGYEISKTFEVSAGFMYYTEFNVKKPKEARVYQLGLGINI